MAALLSSWSGWWSGKGSEGEKEEGEKEEGEKEEEASKTESWSAGIGSKKLLGRNTPHYLVAEGQAKVCSQACGGLHQ